MMIRKIAGWTIQRDECGGILAERDRDMRSLRVPANPFFDPFGQSLRSLLTDLLNEPQPETATMVVTDRQLADAVNELRDIAIKFHSAGQLRERIAGVVRGLVRGEPAPVVIGFDPAAPGGDKTVAQVVVAAADGLCGRCFGKGHEHGVYERYVCPDCNGSGRLLAGGE